MTRHLKTLFLAAGIALAVTACSTTPSPTVTSITITGPQLAIGGSGQFTATANFSDGTTLNVSASSTWTSSNTAVATVSATGLVTGVSGIRWYWILISALPYTTGAYFLPPPRY